MELLLTGSEERDCSFFSGDAGMAEACLVSLIDSSIRSEIVRVDQIDQTDEIDQTDQIDETTRQTRQTRQTRSPDPTHGT